jgi:hypothetical protein
MAVGLLMPGDPPQRTIAELHARGNARQNHVKNILRLCGVPYAAAGHLSAKLPRNGILKTHQGFPHGVPTTEAPTINADLLAFIKG